MRSISETAYITSYARYIAGIKYGISDMMAAQIWKNEKDGISLPLLYSSQIILLCLRSGLYDMWLKKKLDELEDPVVIHLGCGLDDRYGRTEIKNLCWYDIDFEQIIHLRKKYYKETENHHMLSADISDASWLETVKVRKNAIVIAEGVFMYLEEESIKHIFCELEKKFERLEILFDSYTQRGMKMVKLSHPWLGIRSSIKCNRSFETGSLSYKRELDIRKSPALKKMPAQIRFAAGISFFRPERLVFRILEYVK